MPLKRGKKHRKANFRELGAGKTYARTKKRQGKRAADRQRVAIVLSNERRGKRRSSR